MLLIRRIAWIFTSNSCEREDRKEKAEVLASQRLLMNLRRTKGTKRRPAFAGTSAPLRSGSVESELSRRGEAYTTSRSDTGRKHFASRLGDEQVHTLLALVH